MTPEPATLEPVSIARATAAARRRPPVSRYDLTRADFERLLGSAAGYRVDQLWESLYRRFEEPARARGLPRELRERLAGEPSLSPALELEAESVADSGDTVKWLFRCAGAAEVETVLMHHPRRSTACVSSQAGCAMACAFCATGQAGFRRHLGVGEILEQVVRAARAARERGRRLDHVVVMGMGEPLANYDNVLDALRRVVRDVGIGARRLTVSTVGVVPGIRRLAREPLQLNLAVSLHAANDPLRDRLVPLNRRYPIGVLVEACEEYLAATHRRISLEWALIDGVNDRSSDADELAAIARRLRAHVNLIPLNPTPGYHARGTSAQGVRAFGDRLAGAGVNVTVRRTRGRSIDAACGQLAARASAGARS